MVVVIDRRISNRRLRVNRVGQKERVCSGRVRVVADLCPREFRPVDLVQDRKVRVAARQNAVGAYCDLRVRNDRYRTKARQVFYVRLNRQVARLPGERSAQEKRGQKRRC